MKKVLFITVRSDIGGGPKHVMELVTALKSKGVIPYIAAPLEEPFGPRFQELTPNFIAIPKRAFCPLHFLKLLNLVVTENIDIVHSHGRGAGLYSRLLNLFGIKVIHTFHGAHAENTFIGRIKVALDKVLSSLTNSFICVSSDEMKKVMELNFADPAKIHVVDNGINIADIHKSFESLGISESRERFGIAGGKIVLGTLARLHYQKGLDVMLDTLAAWKKKENSLPFIVVVAGDGEEKMMLEKKCRSLELNGDVTFLGPVSDPIPFLKALDIYISFARWEGLPLSVLEAMSCPLPCVLSDITGHKTLARNNGCLLFNLASADDFRAKLSPLIADIRKRGELKENALATVEKNHSLEKMANETWEVYTS